eukprot:GEMP01054139.1.p1 GENE.GEMP01054139.1~~GEMP01054139.1.p1  ORF type:complete len:326 (+),score=82.29 GEMP01054139.1:28-1005(+)
MKRAPSSNKKTTNVRVKRTTTRKNVATTAAVDTAPRKKTAARTSAKAAPKTTTPKLSHTPLLGQPPKDWLDTFTLVEELRCKRTAPVDTIGCGSLAHKGPHFIYQTLIAGMLSSQTRDQATAAGVENLRKLPGGCTMKGIQGASEEEVATAIHMVGFANTKAKHIKETTSIVATKFKGKVPDSIEGLTSLPGVGMKMAQLVMQCGFNKTVGVCVDVHVHKICNTLGWVNTPNPERTRVQLESWLPQRFWGRINYLFVGLGQMIAQDKKNLLTQCLESSRPIEALKLVDSLGCDFRKFKDKYETVLTYAAAMRLPEVETFLKKQGL